MQYFLAINGLVVGFLSLFFGYLIISKDKKNIVNITLFLLTIATAWWSFAYWQWLLVVDNYNLAFFWVRILSIGSIFIPIFFFHWIIVLLKLENKFNKLLIYISYFLSFIFLLFSFSNLFIATIEPASIFPYWPKPGILYSLYLFIVYIGLVSYSLFLITKEYKESVGVYKNQLFYVLLGALLGLGGGATNFFLWYDIPIIPVGSFLIFSYPVAFTYAIIKHRLMDIKVVLRKYSVYLSSVFFVSILAIAIKYISIKELGSSYLVIDLLILLLSLLVYPNIKQYFYKFSNKYLFSSLYDTSDIISSLNKELSNNSLNVKKIYDLLNKTLGNAFHFKTFAIFKFNETNNNYQLQYSVGFDFQSENKFFENSFLHNDFVVSNKIVIVEELFRYYDLTKIADTMEFLNKHNIDILTPLVAQNKIIGLIVLGKKESGDMYNDEDLKVLNIISSQAALAIDNSLLYEETLNFNMKLTQEIEKATFDLRVANAKLRKLDEAKSEFISIASHQLRTPLTVIKGYISMMLEGSYGKLSFDEMDALSKVYESNERLVSLVENLLNVSRIESGKLQFNFSKVQLEKLVGSVFEELQGHAKKKKIKFTYVKPEEKLPEVVIDEEKLRQVIMNLVDNAIKYTAKGSVTVTLKKKNKSSIEFSVSDSGMGIHPEDMKNLFKKFSRGKGTSLVHTEGTGLGLYVAKKMILIHKGKIWAESRGEKLGSRFCFTLPIKKS